MSATDKAAAQAPARRRSLRQPFMTGLVAVLDVGLIQAILSDGMAVEFAVAAHSGVVLTLAALSVLLLGRAALSDLTRLLLLLLAGPIGGPAMLAGMIVARLLPEPKRDATRRDPVAEQTLSERLLDDIRQDRRRRQRQGGGPVPMTWTVAFGTDAQRHALLGVIARRFTPEMRPALDMALASPEAALRVQSASVYAKLRDDFARRAAELTARHERPGAGSPSAALLAETRAVARSGFLEEGRRVRLEALLAELDYTRPATEARHVPGRADRARHGTETSGDRRT